MCKAASGYEGILVLVLSQEIGYHSDHFDALWVLSEAMASGALSRSLGCCSASMRRSYASLSSSCRLDGAWTGYYGPDFVPPVTRTLAGATTGILPFATSQLCAWQLQMPTASQVIGRLSGILPRAWVDGLTDGLVLTSHQTYRPKVLKRKREHGFLKRCGNYSFHTHLGNVLKPSAACVSTIVVRFIEPDKKITVKMMKPIETS